MPRGSPPLRNGKLSPECCAAQFATRRAPATQSGRVPMHSANIASAKALIDEVTLRLHAPHPVSARGMARLRQLLSDGTGPLYRHGRGDLTGRLGAALAAL
jgi:hypothetical protein